MIDTTLPTVSPPPGGFTPLAIPAGTPLADYRPQAVTYAGAGITSFTQVPARIVLDIDDTEDEVHGGQQLALFNAHYDSRCFQPIHIYEATTAKPVAIRPHAPARRRTAPRSPWCCAM